MPNLPKKTLDQWLDEVNYKLLNSENYKPTEFALKFMNTVKLINGKRGESHVTPPVHLAMLDKLETRLSNRVINCCSRGLAKTTVFAENLPFYVALFHELPHLKDISVMIYVADTMENGAKSLRKNIEYRYRNSEFLLKYLPENKAKFTDNFIEFTNIDGAKFAIRLYGATSGIRGVKEYGKRPQLCIIDDIFSDEAARSKAIRDLMEATINDGVMNAMDPTNNLIIFNGTPFNKEDLLVKSIESGAWDVSVYPICERFPCTKEEFVGAWEDRFSYKTIKDKYEFAERQGKRSSFFQELMLRITSSADRLIQDNEILWYNRLNLLSKKENFNFYITTDFATSSRETADFSVISVWAISNNNDWFWVDGICEKQTMNLNIDALFKFVIQYNVNLQSVGIENTGQQGGFISWIQSEMLNRNIFFNLARQKDNKGVSTSLGIRPTKDKLSRLHLVVPHFKAGKVFFPSELKYSPVLTEFISEIKTATYDGIKGKDDCLDTISMLAFMPINIPNTNSTSTAKNDSNIYFLNEQTDDNSESTALESYIV